MSTDDARLRRACHDAVPYMYYAMVAKSLEPMQMTQIEALIFHLLKRNDVPFFYTYMRKVDSDASAMRPFLIEFFDKNPDVLPWTTTAWGPVIWDFLHLLSINVRGTCGNRMKMFVHLIHNLNFIIPCGNCARHFIELKHQQNDCLRGLRINPVLTVYYLHCLITENIISRDAKQMHIQGGGTGAAKRFFTREEFMQKYNVETLLG